MLFLKKASATKFYVSLFVLLMILQSTVSGQCQVEIVEKTDSSFVIKAKSFKGLAYTRNWSFGEMHDINNKKWLVTTKNLLELPEVAQIDKPTLQEICSFEDAFKDWWNKKANRERIKRFGISLKEEHIEEFNRQYIAYNQNSKKYIQTTLFDSQMFDESEWKQKPILCDHCWPGIFMLNYDVERQQITLNINFK